MNAAEEVKKSWKAAAVLTAEEEDDPFHFEFFFCPLNTKRRRFTFSGTTSFCIMRGKKNTSDEALRLHLMQKHAASAKGQTRLQLQEEDARLQELQEASVEILPSCFKPSIQGSKTPTLHHSIHINLLG